MSAATIGNIAKTASNGATSNRNAAQEKCGAVEPERLALSAAHHAD
jgi:hypothetical protein